MNCPEGCLNTIPPFCHCISCGESDRELNEDGTCKPCLMLEADTPEVDEEQDDIEETLWSCELECCLDGNLDQMEECACECHEGSE